ncbi:hypothetical protein MHK_008917 [Candidatus Magnetomorum sp. HK-1]|nr:hypothetical protein MHK_008917 [Candidatus Magnetomorum sp. HK-1]
MSQNQTKVEPDKHPEKNTASQTSHVLFGCMMKESLIPLNLEVESSYEVGKGPPKLDVLIIRRTGARWSKAQMEFLPDGIRHSHCKHVILELKYTESINQVAVFQTLGYLGSYVKLKSMKVENVCAFIVSSKTPQQKVLEQIGFEPTDIKGVYRSKDILLKPIQLISLNDLSDAPYNLWIKLFSSKITQRLSVLKNILSLDIKRFSKGLIIIFIKILKFWSNIGGITMQRIKQEVLYDTSALSDDEIAFFISLFKPESVIKQFKPKDVVAQFKPEEMVTQFKPEDRLHGLKPEDLLKSLDLDTIEAYLKKIKKTKKQIKKNSNSQ